VVTVDLNVGVVTVSWNAADADILVVYLTATRTS
jgi:hypothetical protein